MASPLDQFITREQNVCSSASAIYAIFQKIQNNCSVAQPSELAYELLDTFSYHDPQTLYHDPFLITLYTV